MSRGSANEDEAMKNPYTDEWKKWLSRKRTALNIEQAKERKRLRNLFQQGGDNFRFVRWGGLADLPLWKKR
jgi:hypothetical protein